MTSTVLDVTVLLLCVSASVVVLGGAGGDAGTSGPTVGEAADRLVTETATVRYRAPGAANDTRTVHATRAELLALLVADAEDVGIEPDAAGSRDDTNGNAFEARAKDVVAAGIDERTRIDATIPTVASREGDTAPAAAGQRVADPRGGRRSVWPIAASGTPNAPRAPRRIDGPDGSRRSEERRSVTGNRETISVGAEPPRNADVATAIVTHPAPSAAGTDAPVRIVVRRW